MKTTEQLGIDANGQRAVGFTHFRPEQMWKPLAEFRQCFTPAPVAFGLITHWQLPQSPD
jgi:hypothetical protein